jgi:DNA transformation protein
MATSRATLELLRELLEPVGAISVRRMFSGAGIYCDGLMFALVADDTLYFKADDRNRPAFEAEGMSAFAYEKKGGRVAIMSFWRVPERLLDEPDEFVEWARDALAAAHRAASAKSKRSQSG